LASYATQRSRFPSIGFVTGDKIMFCSKDTANTARIQDHSSAQALRHLMAPIQVSSFTPEENTRLEKTKWQTKVIEKGQTVIDQGELRSSVSVLISGWAFRYQTLHDGKRQILDFIFAGALIGFGSGPSNAYGVETVTSCVLASLPASQFRRLLTESPTLAVRVAERICDSETRAHEHMTSLGRKSARERVSTLIVELVSRTCTSGSRSNMEDINLPLTQMMIGDALGLSNEHVCRMLSKLAQDGIVEISRNTLRVRNATRLMAEAGIDFSSEVFEGRKILTTELVSLAA
jgi:CRP/FNR family transcriptional regulator, anaerobic regulatory protein